MLLTMNHESGQKGNSMSFEYSLFGNIMKLEFNPNYGLEKI